MDIGMTIIVTCQTCEPKGQAYSSGKLAKPKDERRLTSKAIAEPHKEI